MKTKRKGRAVPLLGVNIDHVATLRQARRGTDPRPRDAALEAVKGGARQITVHLREDRRHIQDRDLPELKKALKVPINLEMALNPEIVEIALALKPAKVCMVPEKRAELTTEGGLDVLANAAALGKVIPRMRAKGISVSLFVNPDEKQVRKAAELGADAVELHTGRYAEVKGAARKAELLRLEAAAKLGKKLGLRVDAGHGIDYENVRDVCRITEIEELNIGYAIVCRAVFTGLRQAVGEMKKAIKAAC